MFWRNVIFQLYLISMEMILNNSLFLAVRLAVSTLILTNKSHLSLRRIYGSASY